MAAEDFDYGTALFLDLDGTLLLLASDHGRFITGALFTVDDGQSL